MSIRVVLVDDQALVRGGLRALIEAEPDLTVAGEATDGAQALAAVRAQRPAIVLMDIGIAWSGPVEHITMDVWSSAVQWFLGLLVESWAVGGTDDVFAGYAALMLSLYVIVAATAARCPSGAGTSRAGRRRRPRFRTHPPSPPCTRRGGVRSRA